MEQIQSARPTTTACAEHNQHEPPALKITAAIHKPLASEILRWSQRFLVLLGILSLGYVGFVLADAKVFQAYQHWRFQQGLNGVQPLPKSSLEKAKSDNLNALDPRSDSSSEGFPLGMIRIGAVGLEVMILEGIKEETLRRAVGHIPGTALPGQDGNAAIAGHRDTFFRPLRHIQKNDEITLTTLSGIHRYRVASTKIVQPEEVDVLDDSDDAVLTLVTCYPFSFVGAAPQRFIVRAHKSLR